MEHPPRYEDTMEDIEEDYTGPIIQQIPDNLMVGDYIEINGVCLGQDVFVELLNNVDHTQVDTGILPLHIHLSAGGPVLVKNQSKHKVERQEHYVRMGLQPNLAFELCIYALEDGYEIRLNKEVVCIHKHLVPLEEVCAISMDGEAEFNSIEFKDIYGDDAEVTEPAPETQPGFIRVQELRESFSRHKGSPVLVRTSTRRSNRSRQTDSPVIGQKAQWQTSQDLSRPDIDRSPNRVNSQEYAQLDVDPTYVAHRTPRDDLITDGSRGRLSLKPGSRKSITLEESKLEKQAVVGGTPSRTLAGDYHRGSYQPTDDEYRPINQPTGQSIYANVYGSQSSMNKSKGKKGSSIWTNRTSKGSESDLSTTGTETEKKRKGLKGLFRGKKGTPSGSKSDVRQSSSLPDVSRNDSDSYLGYSSTTMNDSQLYLGAGADMFPVRGPVPKDVLKDPASEIAAYMAGQKAVPEFENFTLTAEPSLLGEGRTMSPALSVEQMRFQSQSMPEGAVAGSYRDVRQSPRINSGIYQNQTSYNPELVEGVPVRGPIPKDVTKESSAEIAAYVAGQKAVPEMENYTLTTDPGRLAVEARSLDRISAAPVQRSSPPSHREPSKVLSTVRESRKLKGTAPELADILLESNQCGFDQDSALTAGWRDSRSQDQSTRYGVEEPKGPTSQSGIVQPVHTVTEAKPKGGKLKGPAPEIASQLMDENRRTENVFVETTLSGMQLTEKQKSPRIERPVVDRDPYRRPDYTEAPYVDRILQEEKTQAIHVQRPVSSDRYPQYDDHSDDSTVHSDAEYYLEVGSSDYYLERKRSLKNYRSKRSRTKDREARSSMGFPDRSDSMRSSISSLKSGDRVMYAGKIKQSTSADRARNQTYMNGYVEDAHAGQYITPSKSNRNPVYAAPQTVSQPICARDLLVDARELRDAEYGAAFPLALDPGRSARLMGHFSNSTGEPQSCLIRASSGIQQSDGIEYTALLLQPGKDRSLAVYGAKLNQRTKLAYWSNPDAPIENGKFALEFHARGLYSAITYCDFVTLRLPNVLDPASLKHVQLEEGTDAQLDEFSVSEHLILPLVCLYPVQSHREEMQSLTLKTKLTAQTKDIHLEFHTQTGKSVLLVFDFIRDHVYVRNKLDDVIPSGETLGEIPFVPEQIRVIKVERRTCENELIVSANELEIYRQLLPLSRPVGKFNQVQIRGGFVLLDAQLS